MKVGGRAEFTPVVRNQYGDFELPTIDLLDEHQEDIAEYDGDELVALSEILVERLTRFWCQGRGGVHLSWPGDYDL